MRSTSGSIPIAGLSSSARCFSARRSTLHHLASKRTPVSRMWVPPPAIGAIRSFCDVGAYDGDTLTCMKAVFPGLMFTFAVEPNASLCPKIDAAAERHGLTNRTFVGLAWSHKTKLDVRTLPNGMMVVSEDAGGAVAADTLDHVTAPRSYDYVKFDVEGAEIAALNGARSLIRSARCVAVAAYHLPNDIFDIPNSCQQTAACRMRAFNGGAPSTTTQNALRIRYSTSIAEIWRPRRLQALRNNCATKSLADSASINPQHLLPLQAAWWTLSHDQSARQ